LLSLTIGECMLTAKWSRKSPIQAIVQIRFVKLQKSIAYLLNLGSRNFDFRIMLGIRIRRSCLHFANALAVKHSLFMFAVFFLRQKYKYSQL